MNLRENYKTPQKDLVNNFFIFYFALCLDIIMVTFSLFLTYEDESTPRIIAEGCTKEQLFEILSRHIMLAQVAHFKIVPFEFYIPFHEYTI